MAYPTSLDSFPSATTLAANNLNTDPHSTLHGNLGNAVAALEAKLGADSSAVTTSVDYKINHLGGDLTGTVTAATIAAGAVTLAKHANLAANTFIGNNTASPATPMALTTTQAKALLAVTTADVSGTVAIANGGTGQTTQQAALNALAAAQTNNQVLAGNGTNITLRALLAADVPSLPESQITNLVSDLAAKSLRLTPTVVKTTGYTAVSGDYVGCDTTSAGFTVTLPTAPADGTTIAVALVKQSSTNAVTVAAGGSDVFDVAAGTTTATISLLFQTETFQYKASTSIWYRTSSRFPKTQLYSSFSGDATVNSSGVVTLATVPVAKGGTNGTTATTARAGLQIDAAHTVADADYTVAAGVFIVFYSSITAARVVTLPAANSINAGESVVVADASGSCSATNTITTTRAGADTIDGVTTDVLNVSYQIRRYISDGTSKWTADKSTFQAVAGAGITLTNDTSAKTTTFASKGVNVQTLLSNGTATWTKPANALAVYVEVIGGGAQGGGGMSGAAAGVRGGGGGGACGARKGAWLDPADLGGTETMTCGAGGSGSGAGGGTGGAVGTAGAAAANSSFGSHVLAPAGAGGGGGTAGPGGAGGLGPSDTDHYNSIFVSTIILAGQGGSTAAAAAGGAGTNGGGSPGSGAAGGSIDASNNRRDGGAGGAGTPTAVITGGTAGTGSGTSGGNGTATTEKHQTGAGGGGGAASSSNGTNGGDGGTGSKPGGGGGGGGATVSGGTARAGNGGVGGDGSVRVWTWVGSGA